MIPAHPRHLELLPGWNVESFMAKAKPSRVNPGKTRHRRNGGGQARGGKRK